MIKVKGRRVFFSGKDEKQIKQIAKDLGMSPQHAFTGMLWEHVMRCARQGLFKKEKTNV